METSESTTNILPALLAAKCKMNAVGKGGENKFDNYTYSQEVDWYKATKKHLADNNLLIIFCVESADELGLTISGKQTKTRVHGTATLFHTESGEWIRVCCGGDGADKGDKAAFKAMTGMKKYGYSLLLGLPTSDDPEYEKEAPAKPKPGARLITDAERKGLLDFMGKHADKFSDSLRKRVETAADDATLTVSRANKAMSAMRKVVATLAKSPPDKLHGKIHALGTKLYGDEWDAKRAGMVSEITDGLFESMTDLDPAQMSTLCERLESMSQSTLEPPDEPTAEDQKASSEVFHKP